MQRIQSFFFFYMKPYHSQPPFRLCLNALALLLFLILVTGCRPSVKSTLPEGDTIPMKFARNLTMVKHGDYTEVILANPWRQGTILRRYALVDSSHGKTTIPEGLTRVVVPLRRCVVFTAAHMELFRLLGMTERVKGVADAGYMHQPWLPQAISKGLITDCGSSMSPNIEKVMAIKPDALWLSPYGDSNYGRLEQLGVPLIELADYMETSALGRAEWMKFYGLLLGCPDKADRIFEYVCRQYLMLRERAARTKSAPKVITERKTGAVWYMPGGQSTMGQLLRDAHADYAFKNDKHSGSLSLGVETVVDKAANADVWLMSYENVISLSSLGSEYSGYQLIRAFNNRRVYGCPVDRSRYFDEVPFRPDLLLRDLTIILHPELRLGAPHYYHLIQ